MTVTPDEIKAYPPDTGRALRLAAALVLCVVPAAAFGQVSVNCPDDQCTHVVSVYKGEGGLIAEADGADMVTFLSSCGGVHISGELTPNDDGVVSMLFDTDNGLACDADGGSFELGPVKDGGWFWITDDRNSAVGVLVDMDVLDNPTTEPTDAGMSVETTAGKGAVLLKEASTGRIGILQTILPEMETAQATTRKCGYSGTGTAGDPFKRVASECALGDGGAILIATTTDPITGETVRIPDGGTVTRPAGSGTIAVLVDVWGNGSGHFGSAFRHAAFGWPEVGLSEGEIGLSGGTVIRNQTHFSGVGWREKYGEGPQPDTPRGVSTPVNARYRQYDISKHTASCDRDADPPVNHPLKVTAQAFMSSSEQTQVTPPIVGEPVSGSSSLRVATMSFTIVCPP